MQKLNLPRYEFVIRHDSGKEMIFDPVRRKYVRLTPEEWVRQHLVQYLIQVKGAPKGLVALEMAFVYQGMQRRADIIVHDRGGKPLLMAECKASDIRLGQDAFDQVGRYNKVVQARCLVVSNGLVHYCWAVDHAARTVQFLDNIPAYASLA